MLKRDDAEEERDDVDDAEESAGCLQRECGHFCFEFLRKKEPEACVSMMGKAVELPALVWSDRLAALSKRRECK